ncbi:DNA cytosine methyltransferase [Paracoccus sp. TOH]|uniref:DNA cytosine methyltransferase n=1 Tax=Paracoccus sp. TOH TaxID=1263728 RepID=UPI0025AF5A54|nr:DNA cytosine methyltransferase [Paracoccus sp. TOH]WJS85770.1 DNA cytosine methyltransferase [Paracoccus sp. TOH]
MMRALDLFSAAAGGWSLGLHRAGFVTIAACEIVEWRRILYAENNPHVRLYEDVRGLTAARLVSDLGILPDIIVGSPPCQDISSANTKGRGIDGERSGLYLEAVRLVGDCRPRWFAFENSPNLRTRGADRLLDELETLGYAVEPCVVGADSVGANHVRKRSWLIGYDPGQLADTRIAIPAGWHPSGGWFWCAQGDEGIGPLRPVPQSDLGDAEEIGCGSRWQGRRVEPVAGPCQPPCGDDGNADSERSAAGERPAQAQGPDDIGSGRFRTDADHERGAAFRQAGHAPWHDADAGKAERRPQVERAGDRDGTPGERGEGADRHAEPVAPRGGNPADTDEARQPHGRLESGLRAAEVADDGRDDEQGNDGLDADSNEEPTGPIIHPEMGGRAGAGGDVAEPWADWNGGLAHHLRLDDGLSAWVADTRIALGSRKGTSAASLIVEAFGDAVLPQIPEAIGRAILRTEAALDAVLVRSTPDIPGDEQ